MRFIGIELDLISGRIAKALHSEQDIRIENFRDTRLPEASLDAVIGNVPFADGIVNMSNTFASDRNVFGQSGHPIPRRAVPGSRRELVSQIPPNTAVSRGLFASLLPPPKSLSGRKAEPQPAR